MHIQFEKYPPGTVEVNDTPDDPPRLTLIGFYYGIFNRMAEECARYARLLGLL